MSGPWLWYLDRATGLVLLGLLTVVTALGVLATRGRAGGVIPRFVTQHLHRNLALLSAALLTVHVTTAVVDSYVDIRWEQAFIPFAGSYEPLWLGLGALAVDAIAVVTLSSLIRRRLTHRRWQALHLLAYAAWPLALGHSIGMGTDIGTPSGALLVAGCVGVVVMAVVFRLLTALARSMRPTPDPVEVREPVGGRR